LVTNREKIQNIIFDFGGVLLDWNSDYFYLDYFNDNKEKMLEFYQKTKIKTLNKEFDRGLSFDIGLKTLAEEYPEYKDAIFYWKNAWHKMLKDEIPGSIELLKKLHQNNYNLYGLTNWSAETFPYVYYKYEFFHLFKDIVVSGREHLIKPEAEIYQLCLERNKLSAKECIFIDDTKENVEKAKSLGITSIHFKSANDLQEVLELFDVII
jgi:2-haloacid dehalogenase